MEILGLDYAFIDLDDPGNDWRDTRCVDALAHYALNETLPVFVLNDGPTMDYPEAMAALRKEKPCRT